MRQLLVGCLLCTLIAVFAVAYLYSEVPSKAGKGFEQKCKLNSFSWITRQPQEAGIALADKPCLGCTVDVANHFCNEEDYNEFVAALADFRSVCKANGDVWMLMEPTRNSVMLSEKMCWGCMAAEQNHFCSMDDYINFEGAPGNAT